MNKEGNLRTGKHMVGICTVGEQNETGEGSLFTAPVAVGGESNITVTHTHVREQEKSYQSLHHRVHVLKLKSRITVLL